jgi:hypothetical protein
VSAAQNALRGWTYNDYRVSSPTFGHDATGNEFHSEFRTTDGKKAIEAIVVA